jgi:hypothetical protein
MGITSRDGKLRRRYPPLKEYPPIEKNGLPTGSNPELFTLVNGAEAIGTDEGNRSGLTALLTPENGRITKHMAGAPSLMRTETHTQETGRRIKRMDLAYIATVMGRNMKANGRTTCSMATALRSGRMEVGTKGTMCVGKSMDLVLTTGRMGRVMWASGWIM